MNEVLKIIAKIVEVVGKLNFDVELVDGKWKICITIDPKDFIKV